MTAEKTRPSATTAAACTLLVLRVTTILPRRCLQNASTRSRKRCRSDHKSASRSSTSLCQSSWRNFREKCAASTEAHGGHPSVTVVQTVDIPVPQIIEDIGKLVQSIPQERLKQSYGWADCGHHSVTPPGNREFDSACRDLLANGLKCPASVSCSKQLVESGSGSSNPWIFRRRR